jgi:hypothetical protein
MTDPSGAASRAPDPPSPRRTFPYVAGGFLIAYIVGASVVRFLPAYQPHVAETDWKQWVWPYWRYHIAGAFPEGHPITDYTFNAQPPLYRAMMALLSSLLEPVSAANVVNWLAWGCGIVGIAVALRARANWVVGLVGAALLVRDDVIYRMTAGGYPRSFGPMLTLLFLAAWLSGKRRLALLVLVVAAALYPSVAVPCGLAIGLWTLITAPRTSLMDWLRPQLEVLAAGVLVGAFGQLQSLTAPDWWGPVVWAKDAGVELTASGRTPWLPLGPFWSKATSYMFAPFGFSGTFTETVKVPWTEYVATRVLAVWFGVATLIVVVKRRQRFPCEVLLLIGCALFSFWVARELAFKLYLPHRMVQHTLPAIVLLGAVLVTWEAITALMGDKEPRRTVAVIVCAMLPVFFLGGDGLKAGSGYRSYAGNAKLFAWIKNNTDVADQFAGNYWVMDEIPLFTARMNYVGWKMAHPFRKGFFEEVTNRTYKMYGAIYATSLEDVLSFADETGTRWLVIDQRTFDTLESGDGQLFEPLRSYIDANIYRPNKARGFALANPPREIVAFKHKPYIVYSIDRLREYLAKGPVRADAPPPVNEDAADGAAGDEASESGAVP